MQHAQGRSARHTTFPQPVAPRSRSYRGWKRACNHAPEQPSSCCPADSPRSSLRPTCTPEALKPRILSTLRCFSSLIHYCLFIIAYHLKILCEPPRSLRLCGYVSRFTFHV